MKKSHTRIVIIGGLYESESLFEGVAETAIGLEMADDAVVFTLNDAINRQETKFKVATKSASLVLTHGAGAVALPSSYRLEAVTMIAPNEPMRSPSRAFVRKTLNHLAGESTHPRVDQWRVAAGNIIALAAHPYQSRQQQAFVTEVSVIDDLIKTMSIQCDNIGYFPMQDDEYYGRPDQKQQLDLEWWEIISDVLPGRHDELLLDPGNVLSTVQTVTQTAMSHAWSRHSTQR